MPAKLISAAMMRVLGIKALYIIPVEVKMEYMSQAQDMYDKSTMPGCLRMDERQLA